MGKLAGLIQAGDAIESDFGRNPLWAAVLAQSADDSAKIEACCDYRDNRSAEFRRAPILKSKDEIREFIYLHPATALRWNRLGEKFHPHFNEIAKRFGNVCFSNIKQNSTTQIANKGLFEISWGRFSDAQRKLLIKGQCMGVLDLRNFFPSVSPDMVQDLLPKFISDSHLVDDIAQFVDDVGKGLPQGSATSQMAAQVLLAQVDEAMQSYGMLYCRYVDDIRIFGPAT
jgi:hypothetical protein